MVSWINTFFLVKRTVIMSVERSLVVSVTLGSEVVRVPFPVGIVRVSVGSVSVVSVAGSVSMGSVVVVGVAVSVAAPGNLHIQYPPSLDSVDVGRALVTTLVGSLVNVSVIGSVN